MAACEIAKNSWVHSRHAVNLLAASLLAGLALGLLELEDLYPKQLQAYRSMVAESH